MIAPARKLTAEETREILVLEKEDITMDLLKDLFAVKLGKQTKPRFNTYDIMTLPKGRLYNNEPIETTVGRFIVNLVAFPDKYLKKFGYVNKPLTKGALEDIENQLASMLLDDEITTKEYSEYLDGGEWIGMGTVYFLGPTMNYDINVPIKEVIDKRDELFDKYAEGIRKGDSDVAAIIEKEVVDLAKKRIKEKGNEAYDFFESGVGKFANNYKKTSIMAGALENPYTHRLDILKSNYIDGIDKQEFPKFTNLTIVGGYSRGVETQVSGYTTKKINNAMQNTILDEPGSDCGSKFYLKIFLDKDIKDMYLHRYMVGQNGELVLLTEKNINNYVGKEILLRSPMFCKGSKICNKCAGELFYKIGVRNAGLLNSTLSGVLMNLSMKKFHDATVKFNHIDVNKYIKKH